MIKKIIKNFYLVIILLFTYIPILVMIVLSFNNSKSRVRWDGFTLKWYAQMFSNRDIVSALFNTLTIAFLSAIIASFIGTLAAVSISNMDKRYKNIYLGITNIPMLNADIATGISLMLFFISILSFFGKTLSYGTILLSHITFNIPYVILSVLPKLDSQQKKIYEAALDLGANEVDAFVKVVLPEIMPGVISGFMLALTMSLDDFIITHFTKGAGVNTLSTLIYSQVRRGVNPSMYALSTLIFVAVFIVLIISNIISKINEKKE